MEMLTEVIYFCIKTRESEKMHNTVKARPEFSKPLEQFQGRRLKLAHQAQQVEAFAPYTSAEKRGEGINLSI